MAFHYSCELYILLLLILFFYFSRCFLLLNFFVTSLLNGFLPADVIQILYSENPFVKQDTVTLMMLRAREEPCLCSRSNLPVGHFIKIRSRLIWFSSSGNLSGLTHSQDTISVFSGRRNIIDKPT